MPTRNASASWEGGLKGGNGSVKTETHQVNGQYHFKSRFGDGTGGTNPEELVGAAHAACYSMALSAGLEGDGFTPEYVNTEANVTEDQVEDGFAITNIHLVTKAKVPELDKEKFQEHAEAAKENCPVSKALAGTKITLEAELDG